MTYDIHQVNVQEEQVSYIVPCLTDMWLTCDLVRFSKILLNMRKYFVKGKKERGGAVNSVIGCVISLP